jgi:photosystem II stability/assembly factor-like uncharacterized protein
MKTPTYTHYLKSFTGKLSFLYLLFSFFFTSCLIAQDFWEEIIVPDSISVYCVYVDEQDSLYLGSGSNFNDDFMGVYKSNDYGLSWNYKGPDARWVSGLIADNDGAIYAGSSTSLYKTYNGGDNWELFTDCGIDNIYSLLIKGDTIFAGGWGGFVRTLDGGQSWDTTLLIMANISFEGIVLDSQGRLYAGAVDFMGDSGGVYHSDNWGESWEKIYTQEVFSIAINAKDELFIGTQWEGIFKSIDAGETWINITTDIYDVMSIVVNQEDVIFVGCQGSLMGGVFASYNDGQSWVSKNSGLTSNYINKLYVDHNGFVYAVRTTKFHEHELHRSVQATVGINKKPIVQSYTTQVFPNPINKNNTLWIENKEKEIERIELYNTNAKQVFSKKIGLYNNKLAITLPKLKAGLYQLVIKFKNGNRECLKQIIY